MDDVKIAQWLDHVAGELLAFRGHDETYLLEDVLNPGQRLLAANRRYMSAGRGFGARAPGHVVRERRPPLARGPSVRAAQPTETW